MEESYFHPAWVSLVVPFHVSAYEPVDRRFPSTLSPENSWAAELIYDLLQVPPGRGLLGKAVEGRFRPARIPPISVIIPTFQEEKYVAETLSQLAKVKPETEVIVVDGGSRDDTVHIARRLANRVYKVWEQGISKARNYGARHSHGEILIFLDADVIPPRDFPEKVAETFEDPRVVGATCAIMPSSPSFIERVFFVFYNRLIRISGLLPYTKFKRHSRGEFIAVRKNEFQRVGGFNESIACLEDYDLAARLARLGKFAFIEDLTVYESVRRIRSLGLLRTVWIWLVNFMSFILRGEPIAKVWKPVR